MQAEYDKMICMADVEDMVLSVKEPRTLKRLDISGLAVGEQLKLGVASLLTPLSLPLEVVIVLDQTFEVEGWRCEQGKDKIWMERE